MLNKAKMTLRDEFLFVGLCEFEWESSQQLYNRFSGASWEDQQQRLARNDYSHTLEGTANFRLVRAVISEHAKKDGEG